ncbi:hypothetical protein D915_009395 [Fasciola hepatica]|uniref:Uncharacterized protein n=1 Tax=Fasciola hepatica TaxID=6192 RepID=A0A4E0QX92_FASHE|nr:hypothetical protein D915_009395 [Fasciola hepatica]
MNEESVQQERGPRKLKYRQASSAPKNKRHLEQSHLLNSCALDLRVIRSDRLHPHDKWITEQRAILPTLTSEPFNGFPWVSVESCGNSFYARQLRKKNESGGSDHLWETHISRRHPIGSFFIQNILYGSFNPAQSVRDNTVQADSRMLSRIGCEDQSKWVGSQSFPWLQFCRINSSDQSELMRPNAFVNSESYKTDSDEYLSCLQRFSEVEKLIKLQNNIHPASEQIWGNKGELSSSDESLDRRFKLLHQCLADHHTNEIIQWLRPSAAATKRVLYHANENGEQGKSPDPPGENPPSQSDTRHCKLSAKEWDSDHDQTAFALDLDRSEVGSKLLILTINWIKNCALWKQLSLPYRLAVLKESWALIYLITLSEIYSSTPTGSQAEQNLLYSRSGQLVRQIRYLSDRKIADQEHLDSRRAVASPFQSLDRFLVDLAAFHLHENEFDCLKQQILWDIDPNHTGEEPITHMIQNERVIGFFSKIKSIDGMWLKEIFHRELFSPIVGSQIESLEQVVFGVMLIEDM